MIRVYYHFKGSLTSFASFDNTKLLSFHAPCSDNNNNNSPVPPYSTLTRYATSFPSYVKPIEYVPGEICCITKVTCLSSEYRLAHQAINCF